MLYGIFLSVDSHQIPQSYTEALPVPEWKSVMDEGMLTLISYHTLDIVDIPHGATVVGYRWVYVVKHLPGGSVDQYKTQLVAKGYTQAYGVDYFETFSPISRLNYVRFFCLSL